MNAVKTNGCTPFLEAAGCGRTETAAKSVVASASGTPINSAAMKGHGVPVEALLEDSLWKSELTRCDISPLKTQMTETVEMITDCDIINACDSFGLTPVMFATFCGQVEAFKLLTSKGGAITDRDTLSLSTLEQCFVGGHASKLSQFCEACGTGSSGEGLMGALATLITKGLIDAH